MSEISEQIRRMEEEIAKLPAGYISKKTINGKVRYYRQWTENKKLKSQYIKPEDLETVSQQIARRKELQIQLKELRKQEPVVPVAPLSDYETNVLMDKGLQAGCARVKHYQKRDCFAQLKKYLYSDSFGRVCVIYGLRRTGKTTMLFQAMSELPAEQTAYIKCTAADTMSSLNRDLKKLAARGFRYLFLDEVTLLEDFIDSAALFSDIYAMQGIKIVLSGTDSLGFWFAEHEELYDRAFTIHTTFIPFREHARLLNIHDIDEYIRYGGTLRAGEPVADDPELDVEEASFRDDESTRKYIDTAICKNIQHSLRYCENGGHFRHLRDLYEAGELTNAINRIIEDINHSFLVSVLEKEFRSTDLGISRKNLRKETDPSLQSDILDRIDEKDVIERLRQMLDIKNRAEQTVRLTEAHTTEIKEYLRALDLIIDCPIRTVSDAEPVGHILFAQPGMRYCQAQALIRSLMQDSEFSAISEREKSIVTDRILNEVKGRMMEDIILLECTKTAKKTQTVFKLQFDRGEFDMVIYDRQQDQCAIYEVKHSRQTAERQYRHLTDEHLCEQTEARFGSICQKTVLYRGESLSVCSGNVKYENAEAFLEHLPDSIRMEPKQEISMDML